MLMGLPTLVPLLVRERHNVVVLFTIVSTIVKTMVETMLMALPTLYHCYNGVVLKGGCSDQAY